MTTLTNMTAFCTKAKATLAGRSENTRILKGKIEAERISCLDARILHVLIFPDCLEDLEADHNEI
jgi:hypothetical protein